MPLLDNFIALYFTLITFFNDRYCVCQIDVTNVTTVSSSKMLCKYFTNNNHLRCQHVALKQANLSINLHPNYTTISEFEWIESDAYSLNTLAKQNLFLDMSFLKILSLQSNALTNLSSFWWLQITRNLTHLDLSHNRLTSLRFEQFNGFHFLEYLNVSYNHLQYIETVWNILSSLHTIDLSFNSINSIVTGKKAIAKCVMENFYLNDNALLYLSEIYNTTIDSCPYLSEFVLTNNYWHCNCNDIMYSLRYYRNLFGDKSISGQCRTPNSMYGVDIRKISEDIVCHDNHRPSMIVVEDSTSEEHAHYSLLYVFLTGILIGLCIGLCIHYLAHRCRETLSHSWKTRAILRRKHLTQQQFHLRTISNENTRQNNNYHQRNLIYCPPQTIYDDTLPSYNQVMNEIFYLDSNRNRNELDEGDC
ncbi:unnamed protein product [Didymodactylos carnosus]|uniref:Uncharacterized protein n=1 Tax=Didymodactylos carnosus TaxID=1234261 RepID=A0A813NTL8_9BILA|nr:unnamed protein product [Didymodactylos carnosus]CAF0790453.1 unnamed protein product [Didymodactylos carnosus]CAF3518601.1 unnamed protein product [Didymodactylos carnosus]CAF3572966.1 unnamed protein product [Didymodactylos carnosus]